MYEDYILAQRTVIRSLRDEIIRQNDTNSRLQRRCQQAESDAIAASKGAMEILALRASQRALRREIKSLNDTVKSCGITIERWRANYEAAIAQLSRGGE